MLSCVHTICHQYYSIEIEIITEDFPLKYIEVWFVDRVSLFLFLILVFLNEDNFFPSFFFRHPIGNSNQKLIFDKKTNTNISLFLCETH